MALTPASGPAEHRFRRPSVREVLTLLAGEAAILVIGTALVLITDWPPMPWVVAAVMLLVLVQWVAGLRASARRLSDGDPQGSAQGSRLPYDRDDVGRSGLSGSGGDVGGFADGGAD